MESSCNSSCSSKEIDELNLLNMKRVFSEVISVLIMIQISEKILLTT